MVERRNARKSPPKSTGRFAYEGLDRVIHEKARLGIVSSLAAHAGGLAFNDLKQLCALTDGNLSRHLAVLADAGFVETNKGQGRRRPQTVYRLTADGRERFLQYVRVLETVLHDAQAAQDHSTSARNVAGWSPA